MFETNSSSCHCMVICSKADWEKFGHAELFAVCAENIATWLNENGVAAMFIDLGNPI